MHIAYVLFFSLLFGPALAIALPILGAEAGKHKNGLRGVLRDLFYD